MSKQKWQLPEISRYGKSNGSGGNGITRTGNGSEPSAQGNKKPPASDELLKAIETERRRPLIVYWTTHMAKMSVAVDLPFMDQLLKVPGNDGVDILLNTAGGDTECPGRLVSLIREHTPRFSVLVPYMALSAGTTFALGADEIIMSSMGYLGPIDPHRIHPLLPKSEQQENPEPVSVQDLRHAMKFIQDSIEQHGPATPEAWAQMLTALFDKIHPLAIGGIQQSYELSKLTARQCLETHMDASRDSQRINEIIDTLCDNYMSHQYRIGRKEAKKIGLNVVNPSSKVEQLMLQIFQQYHNRQIIPTLNQVPQKNDKVLGNIAWLESTRMKFRCEQEFIAGDNSDLKPVTDSWKAY